MKRPLIIILTLLALAVAANGQTPTYQPKSVSSPTPEPRLLTRPPLYIPSDTLTSISQVTDVTAKDGYFNDLQSLIEVHKVQHLTSQYKFRGRDNVTPPELNDLTSNGQIAVMSIANSRLISPTKYKALFGRGCVGPMGKNGLLTEGEALGFVQCRFGTTDVKTSTPDKTATRGRLSTFVNAAMGLWLKKLDAIK